MAAAAGAVSGQAGAGGADRLVARGRGLLIPAGAKGGAKTGPSPVNRRKPGSKQHLICDGQGIPLAVRLTAANRPDAGELFALLDAIPSLPGKQGRRRPRPKTLLADRGYHTKRNLDGLAERGIQARIARQQRPHGSGLGRERWVIERTLSWLDQHRRLRLRYARRADIHEALLTLACSLICHRALQGSF